MSHSIKLGQITLHLFSGDTLALADILPRGVALDGCLRGPTIGSDDRWSFDHHDNCLRMITLSTCEQVRTVLCLGGQQWFHDRDVYINDLDGDTLLSLWLIINAVQRANHHRVRDLVRSVGTIDSHGPAGSLLLSPTENELAEQFYRQAIKPVTDLRGGVREVFAEWPALIEQCMAGISLLIDAPRTTVAEPPEQPPIQIVKAVGTKMLGTCDGFGFAQAYEQGWDVVVLYKPAADGSTTYTIAKRSDLVAWPVGPSSDVHSILGQLNALEPGWGGGSSIGGSPRLPGGVSSRLTPDEVWAIVLGRDAA